jgi:hypothetical protein
MTTDSDVDFSTWIERNPAPSLQALAVKHGGCGNIPTEAWRDFDAAMERWRELCRLHISERAAPDRPGRRQ